MDNKKTYSIVINGISESVKQVDALSDALQFLDQKIKNLESRTVKVSSNSSGASSKVQEYHTEDQLLKNIAKTEQEIANVRREEYQQLLADKDLLKEAKQLQEDRAASERLAANNYANTMRGVKQELSDIKKVMQGTDLGSDEFGKLTKRANELNSKLLEVEKSYGQFGRNVGNYPDAEKGMKALSFTIAGVTQNFDNAKQAYATLKKELTTLQVKQDQGMLLSDEELQRFEELTTLVPSIASSIADAGKPMDNLLDTMESFVSLTQVSKGFSSFFGIDNTKADEAMKKLLALQNAMQGLQKIQKQMQTTEGLGKYFKSFNDVLGKTDDKIDKFTKSLFKVKRTEEEVTTATNQEAKALKGAGAASKTAAGGAAAATTANVALTASEVAATVAAKALKVALRAIGIGLIIEGISLLVDGIEWAAKGIASLFSSAEDKAQKFKSNISLIQASTEQVYDSIDRLVQHNELSVLEGQVEKVQASFMALDSLINDLNKTKIDNVTDEVEKMQGVVNKVQNATMRAGLAMQQFNDAPSPKTRQEIELRTKELNKLAVQLATINTELLDDDAAEAYFAAIVEGLQNAIREVNVFADKLKDYQYDIKRYLNSDEENEIEDVKKQSKELKDVAETEEQRQAIEAKSQKKIAEIRKKYNKQRVDEAKQNKTEILEAESTVEQLRLRVLENGLKDKLYQLDKEKEQTLINFKGTQQQMLEIQKYYQQLRLKETDKYITEVLKKYDTYSQSLKAKVVDSQKAQLEDEIDSLNSNIENLNTFKQPINIELISSTDVKELLARYKSIEDAEAHLAEARKYLLYRSINDFQALVAYYNELAEESNDDVSLLVGMLNAELQKTSGEVTSTVEKIMEDIDDILKTKLQYELQLVEAYNLDVASELTSSLSFRLANQVKYQNEVLKQEEKWLHARSEKEKELAKLTYDSEQEAAEAAYKLDLERNKETIDELTKTIQAIEDLKSKQTDKDKENLKKLKENLAEAEAARASDGVIYQKYLEKLNEIEIEYTKKSNEIAVNEKKEKSDINARYFNAQIQTFRDFQSKINNEVSKQPVYDKLGFGIINLKETKKNLKEAQSAVKTALMTIADEKQKATKDAKLGFITPEEYNNTIHSLNDLETAFKNTGKDVQTSLSELGGQWWGSIDKWVQEIGSSMSSILSSLSEITANQYAKEIEAVENAIDKYADLLNKQKDITQKYADDVNSIEDELKTARGDRRQQLIDNLNAEMAAQRASLAEEKRIEKEQEKLERKKAELEYERDYAEWESNMWQAAINASMAVSMAAVNKWPIPAIPMMSLAAAVGAAQIAAVNSNKPTKKYASGGVIDGNSHAQGGVQAVVGTSPIELEGNEFIIRKSTATQNINLLDYINRSERKLNLSDFIDFYSSNKVRSNIQSIKTKFETGGVIPTLRTDISLSNGLLTAFEEYANRTTVVQVVDIVDAEDRLNKVKVLSGLNE